MTQMVGGSPGLIASSAALNAGLAAAAALGLLFSLMAARGLGPVGYGAFTASLSYVTLWLVVMEGGVGVALTREAAADARRLAWTKRLALWRLRLGLAGAAAAVGSAWLMHFEPRVVVLVAIMAVGMVGMSAMRFGFAIFRAVGGFVWEAALSTLQKILLCLFTAGALLLGTGPLGIAVAFTLSLIVAAVVTAGRAGRMLRSAAASPDDAAAPPPAFFLQTCVPLLAIDLLTGLYFRVDQVLLLRLRGPEETGLYAIAARVIEALLFLVAGTMIVLFPRLAGRARGAPGAFRADFARAWRALWVGGVVLAVNGWLWAGSALPLVFGSAYEPAQAQLRILLAALPLAYVNYLLTQSLIASGHERFYALGAAVCAGVNIGLNLLLIPRWGAAGAAWATVATEGVLLVVCLLGRRDLGSLIPLTPTLVTGAAAALAVAGGWWLLPDEPVERAALALTVSIAAWEATTPWPLWKLLALARRGGGR